MAVRYREAGVTSFNDPTIKPYRVLVDRTRTPAGRDPIWGLPCYVAH